MKIINSFILACIIILLNTTFVYSIAIELDEFSGYHGDFSEYSKVFECSLGRRHNKHISLIRGEPFYLGYFYAIKFEDKIVPLGKFFTYNTDDDRDFGKSYTDSISVGCFGIHEKVLVIYAAISGNSADAVVLRHNELFQSYEYIHLRVKGAPNFVYINRKNMLLVSYHGTLGATEHYYIVGKYIGGKGQIDPNDALHDLSGPKLPERRGYTVLPVKLNHLKN